MENLLVVSAWEPELARFRALSSDRWASSARVTIAAVGIGVVDAAIGATRLLAEHAPDHVLFLGTCGAVRGGAVGVGDVVVGSRVLLVDGAVVDGRAKTPFSTSVDATVDATLLAALVDAGARSVQIANTVGVTIDDALAASLAPFGEVEHLEAYGVARASAGVPCAVVLGVANIVGVSGSDEWRRNHEAASASAAETACAAIDRYLRTSTTARSTERA